MALNTSFARQVRLKRLHRHHPERLFVVPLDHSVTDGPVTGGNRVDRLIGRLARNGVDAVVLHKGSLRHVDAEWFTSTSLIVHLSASTVHAPDPNDKYLVASVEEALRLGADAVSVHVNLGSHEERQQVSDMAKVADACDRWNVPLLAMMYPRGPKIDNPADPALVAHAVTLAADLGADLVKAPYVGSVEAMAEITGTASVPVIVVGGPRNDDEGAVLSCVEDALRGGAAGVAMGRNVFQAADPGAVAYKLAELIHGDFPPTAAGPRPGGN
ncbi:2-amino-3,7-dideoxy-D-threo-hept-6-ulosonate synthase [Kitasatospora herbaricolor]|uniref:2-amino-3,7-dideoxy-D-threo-hept-6-ulosonate synthase n=1 Tax=Kitasatospora herbaricolor TaxID=68217 RepID=UPI0036DDEEF8